MTVKKIPLLILAAMLALLLCLTSACQSSNVTEGTTLAATTTGGADAAPDTTEEDDGWVSAVFGGGPFVTGGRAVATRIKQSGFNTMIIWSVHVNGDGTLNLNDIPVCKNGELIDNNTVKSAVATWATLKEGSSSIKRIELSIGAWGTADFEGIKSFIEKDGDGENTVLYKNFKALIDATGADAVNFDDESCYDVASATTFGKMCDKMGVKVSLCPYTNINYWKSLKNNLGDIVDRIYLQCYSGGSGNTPNTWANWAKEFDMDIIPGFWCGTGDGRDAALSVSTKLKSNRTHITGGFMWLYDELQGLSSPNSTKDYAKAINNAKPAKKDD